MGNNSSSPDVSDLIEDRRLMRELNRMNIRTENREMMMEIYNNNKGLSQLIQEILVSMGYERDTGNRRRKTAGILVFISIMPESIKLVKDQFSQEVPGAKFSISFEFQTTKETKIGIYINRKRKTHQQTVKADQTFINFDGLDLPAEEEKFSLVIKARTATQETKETPNEVKSEIKAMLYELVVSKSLQIISFQRQAKLKKGVVIPLQEIYGWSSVTHEVF